MKCPPNGGMLIPYNGEEVTLHWANKDQYYIKTSEYLRDYAFRLNLDDNANPMHVHFKLVDATEGEHGNVKAVGGAGRVFVLADGGTKGHDFLAVEKDGLTVRFEYRPATVSDWPADQREGQSKPPKQENLVPIAEAAVLKCDDPELEPWISPLKVPRSGSAKSTIASHLDRYVARNTFDYFIHKDLGAFLRRELDFFIKNEVMRLDDIEDESAAKVEQYLSKIKAVRKVAGKVIDFLAQLEDFQKKLWLKKKFVVGTSYLITVGNIEERFYDEICANDAQRDEWVQLFAIDKIEDDLVTAGYSVPLTPSFLKSHPTMTLNTEQFDSSFTSRLLESLDGLGPLDEATDGLLINGENFQALGLVSAAIGGSVDLVYVDPPYNTGKDGFTYKDDFQHSSWMAMVQDRLHLAAALMADDGAMVASIDDRESSSLRWLMEQIFGTDRMVAELAVVNNWKGRQDRDHIATAHERALYFAREGHDSNGLALADWQVAEYDQVDDDGLRFTYRDLRKRGGADTRGRRPKMYFPIYWDSESNTASLTRQNVSDIEIYPSKSDGSDGCWRWGQEAVSKRLAELRATEVVSNGRWNVSYRVYLDMDDEVRTSKPKSVWAGAKYSTDRGIKALRAVVPSTSFTSPKAVGFIADLVSHSTPDGGVVLDPYLGSGTTPVAVIELNRQEPAHRRWFGIEVSDELWLTAVPRVRRVTFAPEWKDGVPVRLASATEAQRSPRVVKVLRLESYEDTLNNLELRGRQQSLLENPAAAALHEDYILRYMLDVESRGSQSLLNIGAFTDPTAYQLNVKSPGSDESRHVNADLLETFNYLIGLTVTRITVPRTFSVAFDRDDEKRLQVADFRQSAEGSYWFRTVTGTSPDGQRVLVIWRKRPGGEDSEGVEQDNAVLDHWFANRHQYSTSDSAFDLIYVNGGNNLENMKRPDEPWKVRLIEEDFHRLMFDTDGMP